MEQIAHILIVDDDREIRELVSAYLRKKNGSPVKFLVYGGVAHRR